MDNDYLRIGWYVDRTVGVFEARPDRMSYSLASTGLSLDELVRIAESVPLP